jgi:hypothetical protein
MVCNTLSPGSFFTHKRPTGSVILFTIICLGMAGHFQSVLAASDLSGYPYMSFENLL